MKAVCYGDSNTYGYDPRSFFGSRYSQENRWVDILVDRTGWNFINDGINGREIPASAPKISDDVDLLIIMLGINDLLQGNSIDTIVHRMKRLIESLEINREKILLVSPPPMQQGEWVTSVEMLNNSVELGKKYRELAVQLGVINIDTRQWEIEMTFDGVHFTESGHHRFADQLLDCLWKENIIERRGL